MVAFRVPAHNGRPSWMTRTAQSTGPLLRDVKNHLPKENVMTDTTSIPLNKLAAWDGNVRKTAGADTSLAELAASIAPHVLLQSLVVRNGKKGRFAVVAGSRRLQALQQLAESGKIAADYAGPCQIIADDADATEISLAENAVREDIHPADEFEAFRDLGDKGMPAADIAARFGVTEAVVSKRLKLARVSPVILTAYRDGQQIG